MNLLVPVSSLLLGATIALSGATGAGLLLVEGTGLLRGAATILALQAGALAAGAWSAEDVPGDVLPEALRLWWTGAIASLALAGLLSGWWQFRGLPGVPLNRGLALGVLVGLPQLALGGTVVLAGRGRRITSWLLAGAGGGVLLAGLVVLPRLAPAAVFFGCMVLLAVSAALRAAEPPPSPGEPGGTAP